MQSEIHDYRCIRIATNIFVTKEEKLYIPKTIEICINFFIQLIFNALQPACHIPAFPHKIISTRSFICLPK